MEACGSSENPSTRSPQTNGRLVRLVGNLRVRDGSLLRGVLAAKAALVPWLLYDLARARQARDSWQDTAPQRSSVQVKLQRKASCRNSRGGDVPTLFNWHSACIACIPRVSWSQTASCCVHQRHAPLPQQASTSATWHLKALESLEPVGVLRGLTAMCWSTVATRAALQPGCCDSRQDHSVRCEPKLIGCIKETCCECCVRRFYKPRQPRRNSRFRELAGKAVTPAQARCAGEPRHVDGQGLLRCLLERLVEGEGITRGGKIGTCQNYRAKEVVRHPGGDGGFLIAWYPCAHRPDNQHPGIHILWLAVGNPRPRLGHGFQQEVC